MRAGELDPLIYAESAQYLPAQGFATYVLRIATSERAGGGAGGSKRLAKRWSLLKAHHAALSASPIAPKPAPFPSDSAWHLMQRGSERLIQSRRARLNAYFAALHPEAGRALAKALLSGDPGAAVALPAGGVGADGAFDSLHADVDVPDLPLTAYVLESAYAALHSPRSGAAGGAPAGAGEKAALVDGQSGRSISYSQLRQLIRTCAAGLHRLGVKRGGVCAVLAPNCPELALAFHAPLSLGAAAALLNPHHTRAELARALESSRASLLFASTATLSGAAAAGIAAGLRRIVVIDATNDELERSPPRVSLRSVLASGEAGLPALLRAPCPSRDVALLAFTAGTCAAPRAAELTHANLVANACQLGAAHLRLSRADVFAAAFPLTHAAGAVLALNLALTAAATVVTVPALEPGALHAALRKHGATAAHVAPSTLALLCADPSGALATPTLRQIISSGAPLPSELAPVASARLGGAHVRNCYGVPELGAFSHMAPAQRRPPPRAPFALSASVGELLPSQQAKLLDTVTGAAVGVSRRGELCVRGPNVMSGGLDAPAAGAPRGRRHVDDEGFLHTGDVAVVDDDGAFYVVDRVCELIHVGDKQVAPCELESVLASCGSVADAAVVGEPDAEAGEVPVAYVVAREGSLSAGAVCDFVAAKVAAHMRLARVEFVDAIPRSVCGKVLRHRLRQARAEAEQTLMGVTLMSRATPADPEGVR